VSNLNAFYDLQCPEFLLVLIR